jgi:phage tail protein X
MLFVDPAREVQAPVAAAPARTTPSIVATANPAPAPVAETRPAPVRRSTINRPPVDATTSYRVQPGDSLSQIAQRIENRSVGLWPAVTQIFEANPGAFINNDPNQLKAGSLLTIPDFGAQAHFAESSTTQASTTPATSETVATQTPVDSAQNYDAAFADAIEMVETAPVETAPVETAPVIEAAPVLPVAGSGIADDTRNLQPGDVVLDTSLDVPATASNPNVPTASITAAAPVVVNESASNWLWWLVGGGIALIAGLLVFGRRGRNVAAPAPIAAHPMRRATDVDTAEVETIREPAYDIDDDSPTHENLVLDANLEIGTGLQTGTDVDLAQDFGFAQTGNLDLELPDEREADSNTLETDIIESPNSGHSSILDSEVLPDDDDYDMSVIVDATKMPIPEEVTERDLKAVVVESGDDTLIADNYTVSKEVDYDILEQDYEEELTATQALNLEIERAAAEIAERMENDEEVGDKTSQMPLATVTELDVTANLQAADNDATEVLGEEKTEEIIVDDKTVEMPASDGKKTG